MMHPYFMCQATCAERQLLIFNPPCQFDGLNFAPKHLLPSIYLQRNSLN